jgi:hypothetical protein
MGSVLILADQEAQSLRSLPFSLHFLARRRNGGGTAGDDKSKNATGCETRGANHETTEPTNKSTS